jgi:predicted nucleotidyltransferase
MKKLSKPQLNSLLNHLIKNLENKFKDNFTGLVLFGSYAKNEAKDNSDLDILITFQELNCRYVERFDLVLPFLIKLEKEFKIQINPIIKLEKEFTISFLLSEIGTTGKIYLDKNKKIKLFFSKIKKAYKTGFIKKIETQNNYKIQIQDV